MIADSVTAAEILMGVVVKHTPTAGAGDIAGCRNGIKNAGVWFTNDPEIDAANGDFIPAAAQQEAGQGDPRWK